MNSALSFLFKSENAKRVVRFLRERDAGCHVIAPEWVRQQVVGAKEGVAATWSKDEAGVRQDAAKIYVVAEEASRELAMVHSIGARKSVKVYGLFGHVLPALLCSKSGTATGQPLQNLKRYAILCVPRCGSLYLASTLANRGLGAPKEHIREPLARIIAEGGLGFESAIESLERFGQRNGIFATKLISTFLLHASGSKIDNMRANVSFLVRRGYRIVRLNRVLKDAAMSSYIARQLQQWHVFETIDEETRARLDALEFDDNVAWSEFIRFRVEGTIINALANWFDLSSFEYSEIESDVDGVAARIGKIVGVNNAELDAGSAKIPVAIRAESQTYETFAARMTELLERRAEDIQEATIRRLCITAGLSPAEAEEFIAANA